MNISCIGFLLFADVVKSAKILAWFTCPSISHQNVFQPIWKELSLEGHQVMVVTPNPLKNPDLSNLTEIDTGFTYKIWKEIDISNSRRELSSALKNYYLFKKVHERSIELAMQTEEVQDILKKPAGYFDLIMIEAHSPIIYGLKHKFKAPLVAISSTVTYNYLNYLIGNPIHPALYPELISELLVPSTLWEKVDNLHLTVGNYLINKVFVSPHSDTVARKYFGGDMPYIEDLIKQTSLVFVNINAVFADRRPMVPNYVQYFHVPADKNESLNEDLQRILDNAKEGAVYFSLGTNVRFGHVQGDMKKIILKALGDLPYTVLCKWESESVPNQPKNVYLRTWFPQQAVLSHPNVKVFVTQGGLQSSEEAIMNAVPLVVIPFLGDQPLNAKILSSKGMAETIAPKELSRETLTETIMKVAREERYRNRAKELRAIFLDQPQSGVDKVVWWCEYVIRHKGAKHLRSPSADISLWEYFMLDVLAVVSIAFYVLYRIVKLVLTMFLSLFKKPTQKVRQAKKKD